MSYLYNRNFVAELDIFPMFCFFLGIKVQEKNKLEIEIPFVGKQTGNERGKISDANEI